MFCSTPLGLALLVFINMSNDPGGSRHPIHCKAETDLREAINLPLIFPVFAAAIVLNSMTLGSRTIRIIYLQGACLLSYI